MILARKMLQRSLGGTHGHIVPGIFSFAVQLLLFNSVQTFLPWGPGPRASGPATEPQLSNPSHKLISGRREAQGHESSGRHAATTAQRGGRRCGYRSKKVSSGGPEAGRNFTVLEDGDMAQTGAKLSAQHPAAAASSPSMLRPSAPATSRQNVFTNIPTYQNRPPFKT